MAIENFNWKGLFVNDGEKSSDEKQVIPNQDPPKTVPSGFDKFPASTASAIVPNNLPVTANKFLPEILEVYEKGFDGLNNDGFDFFELYKSVCAVGVNNPQSYQMAFAMGKSIKPDLTKEFILEKSNYYIAEIEKVHSNYDLIGNSRQKELNNSISQRKSSLTAEIDTLQKQIASLQSTLQGKVAELGKIDAEVTGSFDDIKLKIDANNEAKQKILESINTVVAGVKQYI